MTRKERLEWEAKALARVVQVIELAKDHWGGELDCLDYVETRFDLRGYAAAQARWTRRDGEIEDLVVKINMEAYLLRPTEMLEQTIPHELAHLVCGVMGWDRGHGRAWKATCIGLGGDGKVHHDMKLTSVRKSKVFLYVNDEGQEAHFKQGRHSNLQKGKTDAYKHKQTGAKWQKHHYVSEVILNPHTGRIEVGEEGR